MHPGHRAYADAFECDIIKSIIIGLVPVSACARMPLCACVFALWDVGGVDPKDICTALDALYGNGDGECGEVGAVLRENYAHVEHSWLV